MLCKGERAELKSHFSVQKMRPKALCVYGYCACVTLYRHVHMCVKSSVLAQIFRESIEFYTDSQVTLHAEITQNAQ